MQDGKTMKQFPRLLWASLLLWGSALASEVVVLTTENFEHLTQASTGATTGDWFIDFYAPWCGHCRQLEPTWEAVALELKDQVNVAKVDVTANSAVGSRFDVRYFPTLKFIHQGTVYSYDGKRDHQSLVQFALEGYKSKQGVPVPPPPTLIDSLKKQATEVVEGVKAVYTELAGEVTRVARGEKPADPQLLVVLGGIVLVFILSALAFVAIITSGPPGVASEDKEKAS